MSQINDLTTPQAPWTPLGTGWKAPATSQLPLTSNSPIYVWAVSAADDTSSCRTINGNFASGWSDWFEFSPPDTRIDKVAVVYGVALNYFGTSDTDHELPYRTKSEANHWGDWRTSLGSSSWAEPLDWSILVDKYYRLILFVRETGGEVYYCIQDPDKSWGSRRKLVGGSRYSSLATALHHDGRAHVFATRTDGSYGNALWHRFQTEPPTRSGNGSWSDWHAFPGGSELTSVAAGSSPRGRMFVAGPSNADDQLIIACETEIGFGWTDGWSEALEVPDFKVTSPIVLSNQHGGVEVLGIAKGGHHVLAVRCHYDAESKKIVAGPTRNLGGNVVAPLCTARDNTNTLLLFGCDGEDTLWCLPEGVEG